MYNITENERNYLLTNMENLLDEYNYTYSDHALNRIIDVWVEQKGELIEAFKKHPNYVEGKFMIAFDTNYERDINLKAVVSFGRWLQWPIMAYAKELPTDIMQQKEDVNQYLPNRLYNFLVWSHSYQTRFLTEEAAVEINEMMPSIRARKGEKTSRVINRICIYLGYNKHPDYNREYAKFADALSPMVIKRHTILSINPLDYLTMSFGNSWASCHTIDKQNKRDMPNSYEGQYSSGTVSYMLDKSSMVFYTVDASYQGNEYWYQPKINRQMFHWGEEKLVQGRLYPQDNDDDNDAYTPYRQIVQEIISTIFDLPNLWVVKKGSDIASKYILSRGTHYRDYTHYSNCSLSRIKDSVNESCFTVGHGPICIECGWEHSTGENINCCHSGYVCADCGCDISEDEMVEIDGEYYCRDCCHWCNCCDDWVHEDVTWIESEEIYVCESCLDNYYVQCDSCGEYVNRDEVTRVAGWDNVCHHCLEEHYEYCEDCDEYHPREDMTWLENEGRYICEECRDEDYAQCEECNEWFKTEDMHETEDGFVCDDCYEEIDEQEAC